MSTFPTTAHAQANALLMEIVEATRGLENTRAAAKADLETATQQWVKIISPLAAKLGDLEKQLQALMKKSRKALFPERSADGSDRVDLPHGALLHALETVLKKPPGTLKKLLELQYEDGIKREPAVDWTAMEKWPDERLHAAGSGWKEKETFAYEVKGAGQAEGDAKG